MGRFDRKFSSEQLAALTGAMLDEDGPRMTTREAYEAANRGELPGVEGQAFDISLGYCNDLRRHERLRRMGQTPRRTETDPITALDKIQRQLVVSLQAGIDAYKRRAQRAEREQKPPPNPQDLVQLARAANEIRKLQTEPKLRKHEHPAQTKAAPDTEVDTILQAHEHERRQSAQHRSPSPTPTLNAQSTSQPTGLQSEAKQRNDTAKRETAQARAEHLAKLADLNASQ